MFDQFSLLLRLDIYGARDPSMVMEDADRRACLRMRAPWLAYLARHEYSVDFWREFHRVIFRYQHFLRKALTCQDEIVVNLVRNDSATHAVTIVFRGIASDQTIDISSSTQ